MVLRATQASEYSRNRKRFLDFMSRANGGILAAALVGGINDAGFIDLGTAVVLCDPMQHAYVLLWPGNLVIDEHGLSIVGVDANLQYDGCLLASGAQHKFGSSWRPITDWAIGVKGADGKFVSVEIFPKQQFPAT